MNHSLFFQEGLFVLCKSPVPFRVKKQDFLEKCRVNDFYSWPGTAFPIVKVHKSVGSGRGDTCTFAQTARCGVYKSPHRACHCQPIYKLLPIAEGRKTRITSGNQLQESFVGILSLHSPVAHRPCL